MNPKPTSAPPEWREPDKWQDLAKPVRKVMSDLIRRMTRGQ